MTKNSMFYLRKSSYSDTIEKKSKFYKKKN